MADKYHSDTQEKINTFQWKWTGQDSGDLEEATRTITATSKPATPDYETSLTIPAPIDPEGILTVLCMALRLAITIDSMTANTLNWSVELNDVEKISGNTNSAGDKAQAEDFTSGWSTLGQANSIKIYFWVDADNAVLSKVQAHLGPGTAGTAYKVVLEIACEGLVSGAFWIQRYGTGASSTFSWRTKEMSSAVSLSPTNSSTQILTGWVAKEGLAIRGAGTVASDLNCIYSLIVNRRRLE